jgi:putative membrane protein insertion efficiency factor
MTQLRQAFRRTVAAVLACVAAISAAVVTALVFLLRIYQIHVSPAFPPTCRFYPSCSQYAVEALHTHGVLRGIGLTTWRLMRCHPWHPGGDDPVPPRCHDRPSPAAARHGAAPVDPGHHHEEQAPC